MFAGLFTHEDSTKDLVKTRERCGEAQRKDHSQVLQLEAI